ncbi:plasmid partitioning protein RepB [Siculibacillus lacustris]|uniref:Plasmid partitioning protein RepB n=1 Tax=Siculibacillus lacustris TaxID=1549641 RepID=A0A4Q9VDE6_9HYPH|nr:plasmid partitioning protein RepB [Siculibacillus lacustris]TBW32689.1 plasmid partitioning protein RepB [Siculibacillus lacustris]
MKGKDILRDLSLAGRPDPAAARMEPLKASGAVRAMSLGLDRLTTEAARARDLEHAIAQGEHVIELDPHAIEPSFISDRIQSVTDPEYDELKVSISATGQQVPVLVRPHPERLDRYQAAYGHRRIRAALDLKISVRAIVRNLSDIELVTAQAQENGPRLNLSFIERALFASHLDAYGFERDAIAQALGVDKPELSRLLSVNQKIDRSIILAIGPAPKIGRPRWVALADHLADGKRLSIALATISSADFLSADTNGRFNAVMNSIGTSPKKSRTLLRRPFVGASGQKLGWIENSGRGIRLTTDQAAFGAFLERKLPSLVDEFAESAEAAKPTSKRDQATDLK